VLQMISIGIPTYNQADYLGLTIESLLKQTVRPLEIVVSDNWCTDHTGQVLDSYKEYIKVVKPQKHLTMMENWNFLASQLNGEWFSLISSDDLVLPNFVSDFSQAISAHPDAALIRAPYEAINADGDILSRRSSFLAKKVRSYPENLYEQIRNTKTSFAAFCVNTQKAKNVGMFPEELMLFGDWGLWLKLSKAGDFVTLPEVTSQYRTAYRDKQVKASRHLAALNDRTFIRCNLIPSLSRGLFTSSLNAYGASVNIREALKEKYDDVEDMKMRDKALQCLYGLKSTILRRMIGLVLTKLYRIRTIK